jgi:hypothetical protein
MKIKYIIILIIIFVILLIQLYNIYKNNYTDTFKNINLSNDDETQYINQYISPPEPILNIIKKYNDDKIFVISNSSKPTDIIGSTISSLNSNINRNNLFHFINFLI